MRTGITKPNIILYTAAILSILAALIVRSVMLRSVEPKKVIFAGEVAASLAPLEEILKAKGISHPGSLSVEIEKSHRLLRLRENGRLIKTYVIGLGGNPVDKKRQYGDKCTPEGDYCICEKNPRSAYYLSLKISYPNTSDALSGLKRGLIDDATMREIVTAIKKKRTPPQNTKLGGNICIHGGGAGDLVRETAVPYIEVRDWTLGCVAVSNNDVKELFDLLPVGTPVRILH